MLSNQGPARVPGCYCRETVLVSNFRERMGVAQQNSSSYVFGCQLADGGVDIVKMIPRGHGGGAEPPYIPF